MNLDSLHCRTCDTRGTTTGDVEVTIKGVTIPELVRVLDERDREALLKELMRGDEMHESFEREVQ